MKMRWTALFVTVSLCTEFAQADNCITRNGQTQVCECVVGGFSDPPACSDDVISQGYTSMARIQKSRSGGKASYCCTPGTHGDIMMKAAAEACYKSECVSNATASGVGNLCDQYFDNSLRFALADQTFDYVETTRDICRQSDGSMGTIASCCKPNSLDIVLKSLMGAEPREFPHFVRLGDSGEQCGATLYNDQWIITASHCVTEDGTNTKKYKKGDKALQGKPSCASDKYTYLVNNIPAGDKVKINPITQDGNTWDEYEVDQIVVHPKSSRLAPPQGNVLNDIALVKLKTKVKFGPNVKALRIAPADYKPYKNEGDMAMLIGFGDTDTYRQPKHLQKVNVLIRDPDTHICDNCFYSQFMDMKDQALLVGGLVDESVSPMVGQGDSGGPAVCRGDDGNAVLCGVTSVRLGDPIDCEENWDEANCYASIYMDVAHYHDWIQCYAGPQQEEQLLKQPLYGSPAPADANTHQVHISSSGHSCGGTLIAQNVVLTAAHCVLDDFGQQKNGIKITTPNGVLTATEIRVPEGFAKVAGSARKKRLFDLGKKKNPDRVSMIDNLYTHDMALVKLSGKAFNGRASIPKLSGNTAPTQGTELSVLTSSPSKGQLSQRQFKFLDHTECQQRVDGLAPKQKNVTIDDELLCGVETYSGGSLCDRELGGGVLCPGADGSMELCGVQVFRMCEFSLPNLFMNVAKQQFWILSQLGQLAG